MKKPFVLHAVAAVLYGVLVAVLFFPVVFQSMQPASPDSVSPMATALALEKLAMESGTYPLWQPWSFSGMPSVGAFSWLDGLYYPGNILDLFHIDGLMLQLLHLVFAGSGVFLLLRTFDLHPIAAWTAGMAYMLAPYMVTMFVYGHGSQLMTAAYMPWMVWVVLRVLRTGSPADMGILALLAGFQLQRAHVQIAYYSWMSVALLLLVVLVMERSTLRAAAAKTLKLAVSLGLGIVISLQVYLPVLNYTPFSVRGASDAGGAAYEYATMWSMHPSELLTFLIPGAYGFGGITYWGHMPFTDYPNYAGIAVLVLAVVGAWSMRHHMMTRYLLIATVLYLLVSFGKYWSPVYDLFYHTAPMFNRFRVPSMILIAVVFNVSLLAGFGLHKVIEGIRSGGVNVLKAASLLLALLIVIVLLSGPWLETPIRSAFPAVPGAGVQLERIVDNVRWEEIRGSFRLLVVTVVVCFGLFWLRSRDVIGGSVSAVLLALVMMADLLWVDSQVLYPSPGSLRRSQLVQDHELRQGVSGDEVLSFLENRDGVFRIYPAGTLFGENKFSVAGIESVGGYHPAKIARYDILLDATGNLADTRTLGMLNVGYVLSPGRLEHPDLDPVFEGELRLVGGPVDVVVYRMEGAMDRAWFAAAGVSSGSPRESILSMLASPAGHDEKVFVEQAQWDGARYFVPGRIVSMDRGAEYTRLDVESEGDALLVLSEMYLPRHWTVTIDGRQVDDLPVNGVLRGVVVPGGRHVVEWKYNRSFFVQGQRYSLAGTVAAILLVVVGIFRGAGRRNSIDV